MIKEDNSAVQVPNQEESKGKRWKVILSVIIVLALGMIFVSTSDWISKTTGYGVYEEEEYVLSECLTSKGVKMYGSDVDPDTQEQKDVFGSNFRYIDYVECNDNPGSCDSLQDLPAWRIHGQVFYGFQSQDDLKLKAEC